MGASQARVIFCLLSCEETQVECWTMSSSRGRANDGDATRELSAGLLTLIGLRLRVL